MVDPTLLPVAVPKSRYAGLRAAWDWSCAHKAPIGSILVTIAGMMSVTAHSRFWDFVLALGTGLTGSGLASSDAHVKARQQWEKEGFDRRMNP